MKHDLDGGALAIADTKVPVKPTNALADVNLHVGGGGGSYPTYIGLEANTQTFAYQKPLKRLHKPYSESAYQPRS